MSNVSTCSKHIQSPNDFIMGEKKVVKTQDPEEAVRVPSKRYVPHKVKYNSMHVKRSDTEAIPTGRLARSEAIDLSKIQPDNEGVSSSARFLSPKSAYRKVSVSSRVDLMLKNDLFRKHLSNHTELIKQHMKDKRFLLRKSVSDLNLTFNKTVESLFRGNDNQSTESPSKTKSVVKDEKDSGGDRVGTPTLSSMELSSGQDLSDSHLKPRSNMTRRHSMTAKDKSNLREFIEQHKPSDNNHSRHRFSVPSFSDFKKRRQKNLAGRDDNNDVGVRSGTPFPNTVTKACAEYNERKEESVPTEEEVDKIPCGYTGPIPQIVLQTIDEDDKKEEGMSDASSQGDVDSIGQSSASENISGKLSLCLQNELNLSSQSDSVSSGDNFSDTSSVLTCINASNRLDPQEVRMDDSDDDSHSSVKRFFLRTDSVDGSEPQHDSSNSSSDSVGTIEGSKPLNFSGERNFNGILSGAKTYSRNLVNDMDRGVGQSHSKPYTTKPNNGAIQKQPSAMQSSWDSSKVPVRSTSDVSTFTEDAHRKKKERRPRPYKSDPFTGAGHLPAGILSHKLDSASSVDNFEFGEADGIGDSVLQDSVLHNSPSLQSLEEIEDTDDASTNPLQDRVCEMEQKKQNRLSSVSISSYDSGVIGYDGSQDHQFSPDSSLSLNSSLLCTDSSQTDFSTMELTFDSKTEKGPLCEHCGFHHVPKDSEDALCKKCFKQRNERMETIKELVETEISYGGDLKILKEEFYNPLKSSGLMTAEQLESIFLNVDELIHVNKQFVTRLTKAIRDAETKGDLVYRGVKIGELFLRSSTMFLAFENYIVNQPQAPEMLEQLEKDKELLRIFLQVSQAENSLLRRMHLKSFLVVPVQRIMKYPLLLNRLFKATPYDHGDKHAIKEAEEKMEEILGNINAKAKFGSVRILKRKKSTRNINITEKMEVIKAALEVLGWNTREVCDTAFGKLNYMQSMDHLWAFKKGRTLKFSQAYGVLLTLGQPELPSNSSANLQFSKKTDVKDAAMVLLKEKNGKYQTIREPFFLDKCVVFTDPDVEEVFELQEFSKDTFVFKVSKGGFVFKADDHKDTIFWKQNLKQIIKDLGSWRKRRNAMPNIMIKTMI